jgi:hypothetical protein
MRCICRPITWGGGVGCVTRDGDDMDSPHWRRGQCGVAGGGEEANLGFRGEGGVWGRGITDDKISGFRVWEGSPELKVGGLRGRSGRQWGRNGEVRAARQRLHHRLRVATCSRGWRSRGCY